jgi:hypothetical protein
MQDNIKLHFKTIPSGVAFLLDEKVTDINAKMKLDLVSFWD